MARGRMLNKKISENIQFNTMLPDDTCRLMATWIIAHLDKNGVFYAEPILVKSMVLPWRADITVQQVEHYLLAMEQAGLIVIFQAKGQRWQWWPGFIANQVGLRQDRETSDYPDPANFIDDLATADSAGPPDDRNGDGNAPIINEESGECLPEESRKKAGRKPEEIPPKRREVKVNLKESTPNGVGEKSPETPPGKKPKAQPEQKPDGPKKQLMGTFQAETHMNLPGRRPTNSLWWAKIGEIEEIAGGDVELGKRLIVQAVKTLKDKQLTIGGPESIIKTCRALAAGQTIGDRQNGHHKNTATNQTSISGLREKGSDNPVKKRFNPTTGETYWVDIRTNQRVPAPDSA